MTGSQIVVENCGEWLIAEEFSYMKRTEEVIGGRRPSINLHSISLLFRAECPVGEETRQRRSTLESIECETTYIVWSLFG